MRVIQSHTLYVECVKSVVDISSVSDSVNTEIFTGGVLPAAGASPPL